MNNEQKENLKNEEKSIMVAIDNCKNSETLEELERDLSLVRSKIEDKVIK